MLKTSSLPSLLATIDSEYPYGPDFEKVERLSRKELDELREKRLKAQIRKAWDNVPFYRKMWKAAKVKPDDIKSIDDVRKLPVFDKSALEKSYAENPPFGDFGDLPFVRLQATTGTTGKPKPILHTYYDWHVIANLQARRLYIQGVRSDDRVQVAFQYGFFIPGFTFSEGAMKLGALVIPAGSGAVTPTVRQVEVAKDWGTTVLACTPSYALHIAEQAEQMGIDPRKELKIRITSHTAEPLPDPLRRKIEGKFGCKTYNNWGTVEIGSPTFECQEYRMHINEDAYIFEVLDRETLEPVAPGEEGVLVVTSLWKEAMPMIRYNVLDLTSFIEEPCSCGRGFRMISGIKGRVDDMFKVKGIMAYPSGFEYVMGKFPELGSEYLIEIDNPGGVDLCTLHVEYLDKKVTDVNDLKKRLEEALRGHLGFSVDVKLYPFGQLSERTMTERRVKATRVFRLLDKRKLH